jgi:molecular chaperone GrpE
MNDDGRRGDDGTDDTVVEILGFGEDEEDSQPAKSAPQAAPEPDPPLAAELAAEKERYVRLRADFDNFRKRSERERAEVERYALAEPARQLLPVVDNLQRALAASAEGASGPAGGVDELRRGVEMILRQLEELLRRFGLVAVPALGERFDPSVHEAVAHETSNEVEAPTVVAEFQRGYRLNDRLIRPAMVKVALPAGAVEADAGGEGGVDSSEPGEAGGGMGET